MKNILTLVLLFIAIPSSAEIISHNLTGTAADIHVSQSYQETCYVRNVPRCKAKRTNAVTV